ncbi:glycogenin [Entomortierella parvispora]|uniref:glycogenin glucosyltransferase n=1 Tax=Entomortierella parvispora TaxID=205924 RepID=A0A9P3LU81_9FUNG|nr:glycogenin [Entomortierella parvispora]
MEAFITLLTNNSYASGALVLGHSLRASQTTKQLAILITAQVSRPIRDKLANVYDAVIEIGEIDSHSKANLELLGRPELGITLTKIHVFNQTQYSKVIFLDADTLVLRNIDELFDTAANGAIDDKDRNKRFAAAPDAGWPDCFNSGVFVCRPTFEDYQGLIDMANQEGTFDGGDQGLLNSYFGGWSRGEASNRLPFVYNTTPTAVYSYAPAFQQNRDRLAVVHFIGAFKPWQWLRFADGTVFPRNTSSTDSIELVQQWWNVYDKYVGGKPSDIHEVTHGYDLPPTSQWDRVGLDGQPAEPEQEKKPHYDGWFQAYDHQNQQQQPQPQPSGLDGDHGAISHWQPPIPPRLAERMEWHQHHHHHHDGQGQHHDRHGHPQGHHDHYQHHVHHVHGHHDHHNTQHQEHHHHHNNHQEHQENHEYHEHHHHHHHEHKEEQHHHEDPHFVHNPHHLTDYHYQPPPPPVKIPELPEPGSHRYEPDCTENSTDERQTHHHLNGSHSSIDREINPHHLTDYRYRLPVAIDSPDVAASVAVFSAIIPEPVGLPDMYYPNAWDLPEDPRMAHPKMEPEPLQIENTTNADNTPVPSGKGRPVFPWESSGPNTPKGGLRTPTRTYYNFAAHAEERSRQKELEAARRLESEESALEEIRLQEFARYEEDRRREEEHEKATGSQAFENFRLVNAWDVDRGVQMSMLQKTEKRRPRSRKSSALGIRKGYGLEDMLAYEAKARQEQYEAELIQKQREEEERWQKEQEEARIKEEEMRLEQIRLTKLAKLREEQKLQQQQGSSQYVFRNAWDPPNMALHKKKLRIEDEEVILALPLRHDRRSASGTTTPGGAGTTWDGYVRTTTATHSGTAGPGVAIATASPSHSAQVRKEDAKTEEISRHIGQREVGSGQLSTSAAMAGGAAIAGGAVMAGGAAILAAAGSADSTTTKVETREGISTSASGASRTISESSSTALTGGASSSSTVTKITSPGSHRFVRTTTTTTITRRQFVNGEMVSSKTTASSTGGEKMFEIPAGPRSGSYFQGEGRRTVTVSSSQEASRLTASTGSTTTSSSTALQAKTGHSSQSKSSSSVKGSSSTGVSQEITRVHTPPGVHHVGLRTIATTETRTLSKSHGQTTTAESTASEMTTSGKIYDTETIQEPRRLAGLALQIDTTSPIQERSISEDIMIDAAERQRRLNLREQKSSAAAVAEAKEVLSRYPQATSRYTTATSSSAQGTTSSRSGSEGRLYALDPNMPRESLPISSSTASATVNKGKGLKVLAVRTDAYSDEEEQVLQEEDLEELEYFGERHTRAALPLGSPYMPSTPLVPTSNRYSASVSGFSSRAGSRPTTPGPSTPSRFGPGTPKSGTFTPKRFGGSKQQEHPFHQMPPPTEHRQTGQADTGFSNYRIEWNWKELLGKKPRHWNAEEGEEYYDPYNALSTHGSLIDSDEDDSHMIESSDEDSEDEAHRISHIRTASEGSTSASAQGRPTGFSVGEDSELARESGFVIRGGKIARRRSSMVLDRREL